MRALQRPPRDSHPTVQEAARNASSSAFVSSSVQYVSGGLSRCHFTDSATRVAGPEGAQDKRF